MRGCRCAAQPDQPSQQGGADGDGGHHQRAAPAPERSLRNAVHEQAETGARQQETDEVEAGPDSPGAGRQEQRPKTTAAIPMGTLT